MYHCQYFNSLMAAHSYSWGQHTSKGPRIGPETAVGQRLLTPVRARPCRWNTFARKLLFAELASYMLWLISFMVFALHFQVGVALVAAAPANPAPSAPGWIVTHGTLAT